MWWHRRCSSPVAVTLLLLIILLPSAIETLTVQRKSFHYSRNTHNIGIGFHVQSTRRGTGRLLSSARSNNDDSKNSDSDLLNSSDLLRRIEQDDDTKDIHKNEQSLIITTITDDHQSVTTGIQRRQFLIASAALLQLSLLTPPPPPSNAREPKLTERTNFQQSPINKRSGITLSEPERIYNLSFITYLSRFLLVFDKECQQWWYTQAQAIPPNSSKEGR